MFKNEQGEWRTDRMRIQDTILEFFGSIFQKDQASRNETQWEEPHEIVALLPNISTRRAEDLQQRVSSHEIRSAIMHMSLLKAPGPDGLPVVLYQKY